MAARSRYGQEQLDHFLTTYSETARNEVAIQIVIQPGNEGPGWAFVDFGKNDARHMVSAFYWDGHEWVECYKSRA